MEIVDFLRARLDEREAITKAAEGAWIPLGPNPNDQRPIARLMAMHDPAFVLADIAAKRELLDELERVADSGHLDGDGRCYDCGVIPERLLRRLATPFSAHPDFDPAWKVD